MLKHKPLIIGITGAFGSGKSTASDLLVSKGFTKIILSLFLEEEANRRGIKKVTRKTLQDIGNEWRKKYGADILAKKALAFSKEKKFKKAVVDGIRNPKEIETFRKNGNFKLIAVVANRRTRFNRLRGLERREKLDWKLFDKLDDRDLGVGEARSGLQVALCIAMADIFIENNGSLEELERRIQKVVKEKN